MGALSDHLHRRVGADLDERYVLVWYDLAKAWEPWVRSLAGEVVTGLGPHDVTVDGRETRLVAYQGSYYEVLQACEPLTAGVELPRLLVYVPGEVYQEALTPLRELECLGGEKEPYQRDLAHMARQALSAAGHAESEIDQLLAHENLDFQYLDRVGGTSGGTSPLAPIFGSGREIDVFPLFLADKRRRKEAGKKGLLPDISKLSKSGLGLDIDEGLDADAMRDQLARMILCAEFRADLKRPELTEISQIPAPNTDEQRQRARHVCERLRRDFPEEYEQLATKVEQDLGLAGAELDPLTLGEIDTFPFEEITFLDACNDLIASGKAQRSLAEAELRQRSFWTSIARYPERHRAWEACQALAVLALTIEQTQKWLKRPPAHAKDWVTAYAEDAGLSLIDRRFREARHRLSRLSDVEALEDARSRVFADYAALIDTLTLQFTETLLASKFQVEGTPPQTDIYAKRVRRLDQATAYILADSLRFEMGKQLAEMLESQGAKSVSVEPAIAVVPTITPVGMAALLPEADRSFSVRETSKGICGAIAGQPLERVESRMDHAKAQVPGLVELTLDEILSDLGPKQLAKRVADAPLVIVRSVEIDSAGESLPNQVAQRVMGTILEDLRNGVSRLAAAGITRFVITSDHGHLFGSKLGDDMKIDPPSGGKKVDLHRRCWVGRGGDTPSSCMRIAARDMGYDSDLEFVFPKGIAVFKAGGDLAYHHGGLSLQELVIPVLSFEMEAPPSAKGKKKTDKITLEGVPKAITNRIFSVALAPVQIDLLQVLELRVIAVACDDNRTVGQAVVADKGFDAETRVLTLQGADTVSVGLQLEDETVTELRIVVMEHRTGRVLKDTSPIRVDVVR
jgi:hypothetical protein